MLLHFRVHKGKIAFQECISTLHATKCTPDFRNSTNDPGQNKVDLKTPYSHGNNSRICCQLCPGSLLLCNLGLLKIVMQVKLILPVPIYISESFFICWRWIWIVKVLIPDAFVYVYSKLHVKHLEPVNELLKSYFKLFIKNVRTDLWLFPNH